MLALSLARGGWVNTYHGNLELLDDHKARWFAKVQSLFDHLLINGRFSSFGGVPGKRQIYGFMAEENNGVIYTVVNPCQQERKMELPKAKSGRILFCDSGFKPLFEGNCITLGAEQLAIIGTGCYSDPSNDLGEQEDVVIPTGCRPFLVDFKKETPKSLVATIDPPHQDNLRIIIQQKDHQGFSKRSKGGHPPDGIKLDKILAITAKQTGKEIRVKTNYDKEIWSGLSWAAGEISKTDLDLERPIMIRCSTCEKSEVTLNCLLYHVEYKG
jgi:hypothetical protein